jgi:hypothetical protein
MLWISQNGRWEFGVQFDMWVIGFGVYHGTMNLFLLCFRITRNSQLIALALSTNSNV